MKECDLCATTDAEVWADAWFDAIFNKRPNAGEVVLDKGCMIGWFANAIMVGYDEGYRRGRESARIDTVPKHR